MPVQQNMNCPGHSCCHDKNPWGGGQGPAKIVGTYLKGFVMLVSIFWAFQAIWKCWNMWTSFQGLNNFERPAILKCMLVCRIWQKIWFRLNKKICSSTAQNKGEEEGFHQFGPSPYLSSFSYVVASFSLCCWFWLQRAGGQFFLPEELGFLKNQLFVLGLSFLT